MSFAFEATDTAITEKVSASSDLSAFPGENPSEMELEEWVLKVTPKLKRTYGALLRKEIPRNLIKVQKQAGMKMISELTDKPENVSHNLKVRSHNLAISIAKDELAQGMKEIRDSLACDIEQSMRNGKATLRLKRLMTKHKDGEAHKGDEMLDRATVCLLRWFSRVPLERSPLAREAVVA